MVESEKICQMCKAKRKCGRVIEPASVICKEVRTRETERIKSIKKGDTIRCNDKEDGVNTMCELAKEGIDTDFLYEKDGKKGIWLEVTKVD